MVLEKKVNIKPINYAELNRLSEDFGKRFVPQQELSDEQAFWLQTSHPNTDQSASSPVKIEAPRELPKVSLVNTSLKKLKYHLGQFDNVVKKRITPDALTEGEWGFEHTKAVFLKEIIPFVKTLKDIFNVFDKDLLNETNNIVNIVVNSSLDINTSVNVNSSAAMNDSVNYVEMCNKCLELEAELIKQHNIVEKDEYNRLSKSFSKLEQHCISLELAMQLNKEKFQKNNTSVNQTESSFDQLFELNNLKAEIQARDTTIEKLKANIKRLNKTSTTNSVKKDIDEIETINIELEHREKVFVITALKNDLRKFKGKDIVDNAAQVSNATTIALEMYKLDPVTLASKDKNNRETRIYYLKHTIASYSAYKYVKLIQELSGYVRDTCPDIHKPSEKLLLRLSTKRKRLGVSWSTKSSRSKSTDNTKNDKILLISSRTQKKNKVEDHSRITILCEVVNYTRGSRETETNLYTLSIGDIMASSPICLLSKASKTKSWLWHRRLSHLNFGAINHLAKNGLVRGLPKMKFEKDHLCSACAMGKSKKQSPKPKSEDTNQEKLYLLHMDLYGPMRVASINGKKYILVIVVDYSRFTWVKFLASKDEAPDFIINVGISHETLVARSPQQNGVVERQNRTLVEAARTMLIYAKAPLFLWAEAVATACYTQNRSIIRRRHGKTPYELLHDRKPNISYLHVFGALCYPNNDSEDLGKLQAKADIGIFIGYAPKKKTYRIYNRRTRKIIETIHVNFDVLEAMASEQLGLGPGLQSMTLATSSSGLVTNPIPQQPDNPPPRDDWDHLFQPMFDEYYNPWF
ncbi:retrovirus-related pol polyprotein from transposon TNT 1-94 [Tanacetum coccineum]